MLTESHFERLGLPRRFDLDRASLEQQYLLRSRQLHPDAHQLGTTAQQQASLALSSALNEAYATLRDPFRRADYLLHLLGGPSASELKDVPADFLMEMLELREQIDTADSDAQRALAETLAARESQLVEQVGQRFAALTNQPQAGTTDAALLRQLRLTLNEWKYIQNLQRELASRT
jgi:molecular chaperone HscB